MHRILAAIAALLVCLTVEVKAEIQSHPDGCPRVRFCGCGTCHKLGIPLATCKKLGLFLAASWKRFPSATPAPGMVAWRYGHVFYILEVLGPKTVLAYDPNSGGRKTRIHQRSLAGYRVVNPHGSTASISSYYN